MINAKKWMAFAAAIILLASCHKNDLPLTGSVSGTVTSGTGIGTPTSGVKMYLGNLNIKPDTVNPANNRRIIADSTITDAAGKYHFSNIPEGNWAVAPVLDLLAKMNIIKF